MAGAHENLEHAEHAEHAAHSNKKIALLIAVIALFLAFSETLGKSAQTVGIELNIKASDSWNFFQAKTIRQTSLRTAAEAMTLAGRRRSRRSRKAAMTKQIDTWKATVARYESDPKEQDGRKELMAIAKNFEAARDIAMARYHNYEIAFGGLSDRHRAGVGGRHHQHGGARLCRRRPRRRRSALHRRWACSHPNCRMTACIGSSICSRQAAASTADARSRHGRRLHPLPDALHAVAACVRRVSARTSGTSV